MQGFPLFTGVLLSAVTVPCPYGIGYGNSEDYCINFWDNFGSCAWSCTLAASYGGSIGKCTGGNYYRCKPPPLTGVSISASPQTIPNGQSTTLTASWNGGKPIYTVQWYSSASASCGAQFWIDYSVPSSTSAPSAPTGTKSKLVTPSGTTWYCAKITDNSYNHGDNSAPAFQNQFVLVGPIKVTALTPQTSTTTTSSTTTVGSSSSTFTSTTSTTSTSSSTTSIVVPTSTSTSSTSSTSSTTTSVVITVVPLPPVPVCGFATVNRGGWIGINVLVVLFTITIAALIHALSNLLPAGRREKLKGVVNYEILEAFLSLIIIIVLIGFATLTCNAGASLLGYSGYADLFNALDAYLGNMLFVNGMNFLASLYTKSIQYTVIANIAYFTLNRGLDFLQGLPIASSLNVIPNVLTISYSSSIDALFSAYSGIFTTTYGTLLSLSFGGLFILFLMLPIIRAGALTVVAPLSIIFRSIGFAGPQLRKTANTFLAISIGFYFVLPLMVAFDIYVASCLNIGLGIKPVACSYPFSSFLGGYNVTTLDITMFTSQATLPMGSQNAPSFASGINLPTSFYATSIGSNMGQFFQSFFDAPSVAAEYGQKIAAYVFMSIVLIALDLAITAGFIAGLAKGLDAMNGLFGTGGFWRE